ncbi:2-amino-4-hydroxy-6-hydroxymethyldihydropteridine diphosphokinase [Lagierella sp.]|uniref:2-amino-4-hydroxy-6- hydroxymethyldihydropteridine diphosphokinase n=1 Tax=Lagierella sp. TaxID=2849657 RepID=UPI00261E9A0D|nr:2-amino-4-hydroxy-6-hydroxymethyldihydropteridine diphosphokinase [Lagierella sp.]
MDTLRIKDLVIFANHGVFPEEKSLGQKFVLDLALSYDMTKAAKENDLETSIHYGVLSQRIIEEFKKTSYDLIEEACYRLIEFIFAEYEMVQEVQIELKKPWAPVHLPLDRVSVKMSRKKRRFYLSLGSNMGDKKAYINRAIEELSKNFSLVKQSRDYVTKAWGKEDQEDFLNKVVVLESFEEPLDFLDITQKIEIDLGRERKEKWGPRTIDIDILFIDDEVIFNDRLKVPHPYIEERLFVLEPLAEVEPFFVHPVLNKKVFQLLKEIKHSV